MALDRYAYYVPRAEWPKHGGESCQCHRNVATTHPFEAGRGLGNLGDLALGERVFPDVILTASHFHVWTSALCKGIY